MGANPWAWIMSEQNNHIEPPKRIQRLIAWFCDNDLAEAIEGDLWEAFQSDLGQYSKRKARIRYVKNAVKFLKPQFMQRLSRIPDFAPQFGNYFKIALRNFSRHKLVAGINLLGLSLGLAVTIISGQYLQHHLTADAYMSDADKIYRINRNYRSQTYANLHFPNYYGTSRNGQLLNIQAFEEIPEVEEVAQFTISNSDIMGRGFFVEANKKKLRGGPILYTNTPSALQHIFEWKLKAGDFGSSDLEGVIISDKVAKRYFPELDQTVVGETLLIDQKPFLIRGVVEHIPENAHFDFNFIAVVDSIPYTWGAYTYAKLKEGNFNQQAIAQKFTNALYINNPDAKDDPLEKGLELQPIKDIHLGSENLYELEANLNPIYLYLFMAIGIIVLVITMTNYVNLAIAINSNRFREVGIRKVIGARKTDVFIQFIFESLLTCFISLLLALGLVYIGLPFFNNSLNVNINWTQVVSPNQLLLFGMVTFFIGLLSGWYPSIMLASKNLNHLLVQNNQSRRRFNLRTFLLGFQVFVVIALAGFAFYVNQQLNYVTNQDLGFEKEGLLMVNFRGVEKFNEFKSIISSNPNILAVGSGGAPANMRYNTTTYQFEGVEEVFDDANMIDMDYESAKMFGLKSDAFKLLDEGRSEVYVLNETAGKKYATVSGKSMNNLIGLPLTLEPEEEYEEGVLGYKENIDGFVQDFHYFSKHETYNPLFIKVHQEIPWIYGVNIKLQTEGLFETMSFIEDAYYEVEKVRPFIANFMSDKIEYLYSEEYRISLIVRVLSLISILLAFTGLIGMTYYSAKLMQKEIAIRKVLGAKVSGLLALMAFDYLRIGLVAVLFAVPVAYLAINRWLSNFAFRVDLSVPLLILIAFSGILLMYLGVVGQSYRTAQINPIEPLRKES